MDYLKNFFELLFNNTTYIILAIVVALIVALILSLTIRRWRKQASVQINLVLAIVALGFVLIMTVAQTNLRWQLLVGLLPAIFVVYQAFFLWQNQPKEFIQQEAPPDWNTEDFEDYRQRAVRVVSSHFQVRALFIPYVLPAVLLGVAGIVVLNVLVDPSSFLALIKILKQQEIVPIAGDENATKILLGVKLGAVGAYTYVLLELGRRTFRHDITGASAMWCLVTMVLGPVLAAAVAVLWRMQGPQEGEWWGGGVVLFFTGFAPRRVIAAIEQAAVQLLKIGGSGGIVQSRLTPLSRIRGISPQIEERLSEEGIFDVNSLAEAEPIRLVRNTSFDMRQILSWIDEAILIETIPKGWEALEEQGITGAIDLAWYWRQLSISRTGILDPKEIPKNIDDLANKANISGSSLASAIMRLSEDTQVRYISALYINFTEFAGGTGSGGTGSGGSDAGGQASVSEDAGQSSEPG